MLSSFLISSWVHYRIYRMIQDWTSSNKLYEVYSGSYPTLPLKCSLPTGVVWGLVSHMSYCSQLMLHKCYCFSLKQKQELINHVYKLLPITASRTLYNFCYCRIRICWTVIHLLSWQNVLIFTIVINIIDWFYWYINGIPYRRFII